MHSQMGGISMLMRLAIRFACSLIGIAAGLLICGGRGVLVIATTQVMMIKTTP